MEHIKNLLPRFEKHRVGEILTQFGWKKWDDVGMNDQSPELPIDRTERVLRALTLLGVGERFALDAIHEYEKSHHMTRFLFQSEMRRFCNVTVTPGRCGKDEVDYYWDEIKSMRPSRASEGGDGLRPWDGDLAFHHAWDVVIWENRGAIRPPDTGEKKASSKLKGFACGEERMDVYG